MIVRCFDNGRSRKSRMLPDWCGIGTDPQRRRCTTHRLMAPTCPHCRHRIWCHPHCLVSSHPGKLCTSLLWWCWRTVPLNTPNNVPTRHHCTDQHGRLFILCCWSSVCRPGTTCRMPDPRHPGTCLLGTRGMMSWTHRHWHRSGLSGRRCKPPC
jgi:hypothetical protein